MKRTLIFGVAVTAAAAIVPSAATARVVTIKLTQTRVVQRLIAIPPNQAGPRRVPSRGDLLLSRHNLIWLGNRFGYEPQPWRVGIALMACTVTAYPHARCRGAYSLAGGGRVFAVGELNPRSRLAQRVQITGGTRRYRGATGSIAVRWISPTVARLRLTVIT